MLSEKTLTSTSTSEACIEDLSRQIDVLNEENSTLKKLYLKAHADIGSLQTIVKSLAVNQAQIVSDFHAVYSAIRMAGILDMENYEDEEHEFDQKTPKNDSGGSSGGSNGGMGGMIN